MDSLQRRYFFQTTALFASGLTKFIYGVTFHENYDTFQLRFQDASLYLRVQGQREEWRLLLSAGTSLAPGIVFTGQEIYCSLRHLDTENLLHFLLFSPEKESYMFCHVDVTEQEKDPVTVLAEISPDTLDECGIPLLGSDHVLCLVNYGKEELNFFFWDANSSVLKSFQFSSRHGFKRGALQPYSLSPHASFHQIPGIVFGKTDHVFLEVDCKSKRYLFLTQENVTQNDAKFQMLCAICQGQHLGLNWTFQFSSFDFVEGGKGDQYLTRLKIPGAEQSALLFRCQDGSLRALGFEAQGEFFVPKAVAHVSEDLFPKTVYFYFHIWNPSLKKEYLLCKDFQKPHPVLLSLENREGGFGFRQKQLQWDLNSYDLEHDLNLFFGAQKNSGPRMTLESWKEKYSATCFLRFTIRKNPDDPVQIFILELIEKNDEIFLTLSRSFLVEKVCLQPSFKKETVAKTLIAQSQPHNQEALIRFLGTPFYNGVFTNDFSFDFPDLILPKGSGDHFSFCSTKGSTRKKNKLSMIFDDSAVVAGHDVAMPLQIEAETKIIVDLIKIAELKNMTDLIKGCFHPDIGKSIFHIIFDHPTTHDSKYPNAVSLLLQKLDTPDLEPPNFWLMEDEGDEALFPVPPPMSPIQALKTFLSEQGDVLYAELFPRTFQHKKITPVRSMILEQKNEGEWKLKKGVEGRTAALVFIWEAYIANAFEAVKGRVQRIQGFSALDATLDLKKNTVVEMCEKLTIVLCSHLESAVLSQYAPREMITIFQRATHMQLQEIFWETFL